jgi:hypothetical protein
MYQVDGVSRTIQDRAELGRMFREFATFSQVSSHNTIWDFIVARGNEGWIVCFPVLTIPYARQFKGWTG